jgi:hypothetical protein
MIRQAINQVDLGLGWPTAAPSSSHGEFAAEPVRRNSMRSDRLAASLTSASIVAAQLEASGDEGAGAHAIAHVYAAGRRPLILPELFAVGPPLDARRMS